MENGELNIYIDGEITLKNIELSDADRKEIHKLLRQFGGNGDIMDKRSNILKLIEFLKDDKKRKIFQVIAHQIWNERYNLLKGKKVPKGIIIENVLY